MLVVELFIDEYFVVVHLEEGVGSFFEDIFRCVAVETDDDVWWVVFVCFVVFVFSVCCVFCFLELNVFVFCDVLNDWVDVFIWCL